MSKQPEQERSSSKREGNGQANEMNPPSLLGLQRALMALWDAPEVRLNKVAEMQQAIHARRYSVSADKIADAMLRELAFRGRVAY